MKWLSALVRYIQRREHRANSLPSQPSEVVAIIDQIDERRHDERRAIEAAIDAGPSALPCITKALGQYTQSKRQVALWTLAYLGGDPAIETLQHESIVRPGPGVTAALCAALATRGNQQDRSVLVQTLEARPLDSSIDAWQAVTSAALSLGILRAEEAIPALEKAVREAGGITGQAAQLAASWIRDGPFGLDVTNLSSAEAPVLAAAVANGVPRSDEACEFCDVDSKGRMGPRRKAVVLSSRCPSCEPAGDEILDPPKSRLTAGSCLSRLGLRSGKWGGL